MSDDGLFAMDHVDVPEVARERLSADRRRTEQQRLAINRGSHPLAFYGAWRHPDTVGVAYGRNDPTGRELTCGSCAHRQLFSAGSRTVPKCAVGDDNWPRVTHSVSSDVRAWWPACRDYQSGDSSLSPDAARCLPGGAP